MADDWRDEAVGLQFIFLLAPLAWQNLRPMYHRRSSLFAKSFLVLWLWWDFEKNKITKKPTLCFGGNWCFCICLQCGFMVSGFFKVCPVDRRNDNFAFWYCELGVMALRRLYDCRKLQGQPGLQCIPGHSELYNETLVHMQAKHPFSRKTELVEWIHIC